MTKNQLIVDAANVYIYKEDGKVLPVNHQGTGTGPVQTADHIQERGLTASAGSDNRNHTSLLYTEIHVMKCKDFVLLVTVNLGYIFHLYKFQLN